MKTVKTIEKGEVRRRVSGKQPLFDVHIATPKLEVERARALFVEIAAKTGIPKHKFFVYIINVDREYSSHRLSDGAPPTGHDLEQPGGMSTIKVRSYEDAKRIINQAMAILAEQGVRGNFEIELILTSRIRDFRDFDVDSDFPGHNQVLDAPLYENHAIFRGPFSSLPSRESIIEGFHRLIGIAPNQMVDFCLDPNPSADTRVSRVATFYQPNRERTMYYAREIARVARKLGVSYYLMEQVCIVGEPIGVVLSPSPPTCQT